MINASLGLKANKFLRKTALAAAVSLLSPTAVLANDSFMLEEIIVTAQKREQSLQDVPVSVSAVAGEKITESGITNLESLSSYVPNLKIHEGPTEVGIFIRGLGSGNNQGFEQSVGMFIDGVYAGKARQFQAPFLDVGVVEVLRGPQGTLFGKNTIAGSITINTARPTEELEATLQTDYELEYGDQSHELVLSGPLTDTLGARAALRYTESNGYMDNTLQDRDEVQSSGVVGRFSLVWNPSDELEIFLKYEKGDVENDGRNSRLDDTATYGPLLSIADPDYSTDAFHRSTSVAESADVDSESLTLNLNYDLGGHELTWIAAYSEYFAADRFDADFSPVDINTVLFDQEYEQVSHELRLTSDMGESIDYILGVYYQSNDFDTHRNLGLVPANLGVPFPADLGINLLFGQETETYAAFGSVSWHPSEVLHWTLGLRYTIEEKEAERHFRYTEYLTDTPLAEVLPPQLAVPGGMILMANNLFEHDISDDRRSENLSPSLKVQYDLTPDLMLYASLSKAFKSGGFSEAGSTGANPGEYNPQVGPAVFEFDEEEALAFEIGGKSTLLNGAATLNFALFRTEYDDLQVSSYEGVEFVVGNAAEAVSQGLEIDGVIRLTEALTLSSSLAYLDASYENYSTAPCSAVQIAVSEDGLGCTQDLSGEPLAHAPEWSVNVALDHMMPLTDNLELYSHIDLAYSDEHYLASDLDVRSLEDAHTIVNARIALRHSEGNWEVALLGKNLSDEEVRTMTGDPSFLPGAQLAMMDAPRTVALQFKLSL
ncbi:TonB-dependent receptor [Pseudomaricurvus alkylphenolicus]|uniref:TonB-dependent receptor n=1 Tax=Pseudomaricurvus alkylphenolicus TaxID=1306991 RepID=UPI00142355A0|nr:TonB-dependent receptor [Pseudomaricurvus alkylphenolicus]NIB40565.1 TonB-dependent receptor [Pseudomaricurvus alkylphenolicus]